MQKKILVIEDDIVFRELIHKKLSNENYTILTAADGESGLMAVKVKRPDLVLLDILLPGIDGFEVLKEIKNDDAVADTKIIIISNLSSREDVERGLKLGANDYIVKALFTVEEMSKKIEEVLK